MWMLRWWLWLKGPARYRWDPEALVYRRVP
jgi:hypothetical protein